MASRAEATEGAAGGARLPHNLHGYEALAGASAEPSVWDYIQGGSEDEVTLAENTAAFRRLTLRPRVLAGVSACDLSCTVLGTALPTPLMVAPTGYQRLMHPEGERATARAAGARGALMVLSTVSNCTLEEVAEAATGPLWFQLYVLKDHAVTAALIERAEAAGYRALVITVDLPRLGRRERDLGWGFALPPHLRAGNLPSDGDPLLHEGREGASAIARHAQCAFDEALTWDKISRLKSRTRLPIVLKGILTAEDARRAAAAGVSGLIVSNHGGRQLDSAPATIDVLPEVVEAVEGQVEVYLDGGIRRGTDVLKARALGARAVLIGRPILWGLLARGEAGVRHVLELLHAELELSMALAGRSSWEGIDRSLVR